MSLLIWVPLHRFVQKWWASRPFKVQPILTFFLYSFLSFVFLIYIFLYIWFKWVEFLKLFISGFCWGGWGGKEVWFRIYLTPFAPLIPSIIRYNLYFCWYFIILDMHRPFRMLILFLEVCLLLDFYILFLNNYYFRILLGACGPYQISRTIFVLRSLFTLTLLTSSSFAMTELILVSGVHECWVPLSRVVTASC